MRAGQRVARGSLAAALSTWIALAFHLVGGGDAPAAPGVVVPFVLSWCACVRLAAWRADALRLTGSVVVSQTLFHACFALGAGGGVTGGHHGSAVHLGPSPVLSGGTAGPQMWLAHLGAAVITVLALRSGEQALRRLGRAVVTVARRLLLPVPSTRPWTPPQPVVVPTIATAGTGAGLAHVDRVIRRRGPPVGGRPR